MSEKKLLMAIKRLEARITSIEARIDRLDPSSSNKKFDKPTDYELNRQESKEESEKREFSNLIRQTGLTKAPRNEKMKLWTIYINSGPSDKNFMKTLMELREKYDDLERPPEINK